MKIVFDRRALDDLLAALSARGYTLVGPTLRDGAIVYDEIASTTDLPEGWTDEQEGGTYRVRRRDDELLFGYAVGPRSWKQFLFPPRELLWRARRTDDGFTTEVPAEQPPYAFIGVRACDLAAIGVQDRTFIKGEWARFTEPNYAQRRSNAFIVAVNCSDPANTCFCVSMGTGPEATSGFDIVLTELPSGAFVADAGSDAGRDVLGTLEHRAAADAELAAEREVVRTAAERMGRTLDTTDIHDLLLRNLEHPRWDDVASRCLSCTNCTLVCPTCFCFAVEDQSDLANMTTARERRWDSCFTLGHSYVHGGSVRTSGRSRYRQWLTHKLATWIDQFGTSGCVGCGRCITWCPVAIDITEEVAAIRATDGAT